MRESKILAKFRSGEFARVCVMGHFIPFFVRHAANQKYDGIWIDLEHRAMNSQGVRYLLALCHYNDIDCLVRPPTLERTQLYRYLEDGATGLMIPFISTVADARHVVESVKFPPLGNRGFDGAGLDADYGLQSGRSVSAYAAEANQQTFIVAQIETPEAVRNVEEIAAVPGVDCLFVGPGDLTLRLSVSEDPAKTSLEDTIAQVSDAALKNGKAWGIAVTSVESIRQYARMGAQILPWGSDFWLGKVLQDRSLELDEMLKSWQIQERHRWESKDS